MRTGRCAILDSAHSKIAGVDGRRRRRRRTVLTPEPSEGATVADDHKIPVPYSTAHDLRALGGCAVYFVFSTFLLFQIL